MLNLSWKDVLHYASAGVCVAAGGLTELGVPLPGIHVTDPKLAVAAGLGIFVAGLKGGLTSGKAIIAFLAVALLTAPVMAADLPNPAPLPNVYKNLPKIVCTPSKCNGAYLGIAIGTNTQNATIVPTLQNVSGGNGLLGGDLGYRIWNGNFYLAAEFDALMQTGQTGAAINFNPTQFMGIVQGKVGVAFADILGVSPPNASQGPLQNLNAQLASFLMSPYLVPVADCFNYAGGGTWIQRYCVGAGAEFSIGGPFTIDAEYLNAPAAAGLSPANLFLLKANYNF